MVQTLPNERRMIWTGTEIEKANAQLFSMFTAKNMLAITAQRHGGTEREVLDKILEEVVGLLSWVGRAKIVARTNWRNVIIRPVGSISRYTFGQELFVLRWIYRCLTPACSFRLAMRFP